VLEWQYYVTAGSGAEFGEITSFMRANPDWPQQTTLERRAEEAITAATRNPPFSTGSTSMPEFGRRRDGVWQALVDQGRTDQAAELVRKFWVSGNFGQVQERLFLNNFDDLIRDEDDVARLDRLLWDHQDSGVRQQMSRVDATISCWPGRSLRQ